MIGSAVAYYLTASPDFRGSVLIVEKDPTYLKASTALSSSSIRTQFSNPVNVRISQYGSEVIRNFADLMQVSGTILNQTGAALGFFSRFPGQIRLARQ